MNYRSRPLGPGAAMPSAPAAYDRECSLDELGFRCLWAAAMT